MIKAKELLNKMVEHLSDWLIIRRNPMGSAGGKILLGIAEEATEIENAIEEYVQSHFINNYVNKTHAIDYEFMRIHVGTINASNIKITSHVLEIITDMNLFADSAPSCNYALLHEGHVYFKTYYILEGDTIEYMIYNTSQVSVAERVTVWNIYDEFALYVGISRLEREDNEHLLTRILYQAHKPVNSSASGIQNAIANITGLQPKDVVVEKINEANYFQNDYTGKTLFEQLVEINRDIYRSKRWGVDYWQHDMDYVTYLPHQYDINPGFFQDGIGDNNDLEIGMTRKNEIVHMEVKGYRKDENAITEYYKKYPVETTTKLKLFKPENTINPIEINALIEAGTLTDVTESALSLTYKALRSTCELARLSDIVDSSKLNSLNHTYRFLPEHTYHIQIKSKKETGSFNAQVTHNKKSLITANGDFYLNEFGWLTHTAIKLYANQLSYFSEHNKFSHELNGFKLKPQFTAGQLKLSLNDLQGQKIHFEITPPSYEALSDSAFSYKNFTKMQLESAYESKLNNDALFAIREAANQIKFYIEGSAIVFIRTLTNNYETKVQNGYFETDMSYLPTDFLIHIIPSATNQTIKIKELQYTRFEVKTSLQNGEIKDEQLPLEYENNELTIDVKTHVTSSPCVSFIYVGDALKALQYRTQSFTYLDGDIVDFKGSDVVFEITDETNNMTTICEQNTISFVSPIEQELKIDLSTYKTVYRLEAYDGGHILNKKGDYYLKLNANESCAHLSIQGEIVDFTKNHSLNDIVNKKKNAKYYVSPIVEGFIEAIDYDMSIITPSFGYRYGEYSVTGCDPYVPIFKTTSQTFYLTTCPAPIETFYLKAPIEKQYKAYNKQHLYEGVLKDVAVNKNFNPILPYNEKLFFKITCLTQNAAVYFYNKEKETIQGAGYESYYSIGLKPLNYHTDFSLDECLKQSYEEVELHIKLNKRIVLPDYVVSPLGNNLDLREYLITPEKGMSIYYTSPQDEDISLNPSYIQTERFILESDGFKKLKFCHLYEVIYCSFELYTENASPNIMASDYELIKELGIINFKSYFAQQNLGRTIYIHYTIQKPAMLILDTDKLYDITSITYEAYQPLFTRYLNAPVGDFEYNDELFRTSDYTTVAITEPGYLATALPQESKIRIIESGARNRIAVHKGFYYANGEEYYLFGANNDGYEEYKNDYVEAHNATHMEDGMIFQSHSENLIRNSVFNCGPKAKLFSTDFSELKNVNYFKRLNACEQINLWEHCNMQLEIQDGLYGAGINFGPIQSDAMHYIGLPIEQIGKNIVISFWLKGGATPLVYKQERWESEMSLTLTRPKETISFSNKGYIYYAEIPYDAECFYYLCIKGSGTLDDLILCEKEDYEISLHEKNITKMIMPQFKTSVSPYQRFVFSHQKGYTGTTQMLEDGEIVPTATIHYGYTPLLETNWMKYAETYQTVYNDNCLVPYSDDAYVLTPVIHLKNKKFIKEIIVKANFLSEDAIPLIVYMGSSEKSLKPVNNTTSDAIKLTRIDDYLQIKCNLKNALYSLDVSVKYIEGAISETYRQNLFESELFDLGNVNIYELKQLAFKKYDQAKVYIRTGKTNYLLSDYKLLTLSEDGKLLENYQLGDIRYLQFKLIFNESCCLDYFDIKNIGMQSGD